MPPRAVVPRAQSQTWRRDEARGWTRLSEPERTKQPWGTNEAATVPPTRSSGHGRFPPHPARRATYPSPGRRRSPNLRGAYWLAPGGQAGPRERARGPDVRPAEGVGGEVAQCRSAGQGGSCRVSSLSEPESSQAEENNPGSPSSKFRPWPSLAVPPLAMATAVN